MRDRSRRVLLQKSHRRIRSFLLDHILEIEGAATCRGESVKKSFTARNLSAFVPKIVGTATKNAIPSGSDFVGGPPFHSFNC